MLVETIKIIIKAGQLVHQLRSQNNFTVTCKKDGSYVTSSDIKSEELIIAEIHKHFGQDQAIISEESIYNNSSVNHNGNFWLIDPIDATAAYISGHQDYCINIAYLQNYLPVMGLIYAPALETLWYASANNGAYKQVNNQSIERIHTRAIPQKGRTAVTSITNHQLSPKIIQQYQIDKELVVASAIKFCYIAEGKADFYFRKRNKACDWDIAAGDIIVTEAGGKIIIDNTESHRYGTYPFLAPSLIAMGKDIPKGEKHNGYHN